MKRLLMILAFAGIVSVGYGFENNEKTAAQKAGDVTTTEMNAAVIDNLVSLNWEGGYWILRTPYPVASNVTVVVDGPSTSAVGYVLTTGSSFFQINNLPDPNGSLALTIADILPLSDSVYRYGY